VWGVRGGGCGGKGESFHLEAVRKNAKKKKMTVKKMPEREESEGKRKMPKKGRRALNREGGEGNEKRRGEGCLGRRGLGGDGGGERKWVSGGREGMFLRRKSASNILLSCVGRDWRGKGESNEHNGGVKGGAACVGKSSTPKKRKREIPSVKKYKTPGGGGQIWERKAAPF